MCCIDRFRNNKGCCMHKCVLNNQVLRETIVWTYLYDQVFSCVYGCNCRFHTNTDFESNEFFPLNNLYNIVKRRQKTHIWNSHSKKVHLSHTAKSNEIILNIKICIIMTYFSNNYIILLIFCERRPIMTFVDTLSLQWQSS